MVVNACFILAIITAGIVVMTNGTVQSRYGVGELLPRLVDRVDRGQLRHPDLRQPRRSSPTR